LKGLEIEGIADEIACGLVRTVQPSAWAGTDRGARLACFIRANRRDLELRLGSVALDDLRIQKRNRERKNEERKRNNAHSRNTPKTRNG
jgi:hypothetical protein